MGLTLERPTTLLESDETPPQSEQRPIPRTPTHSIVSVSPSEEPAMEIKEKEHVPTVIRWTGDGEQVYVTGTFNDWKYKIPLNRSAHEWTTIEYLPPGVHQYKFIVDGKWKHAKDQPIAADSSGHLNNCVEIAKPEHPIAGTSGPGGLRFPNHSPEGRYDQCEELPSEHFKPPPKLPPHLMRSLLNTSFVSEDDPSVLPLPHHVMIDHCYRSRRDDEELGGVTVLGSTHRFKTKFVTTVYYMPSEAKQ